MRTIPWGPLIGLFRVEDDFINLLLKDSESLTQDARPDLAGVIKDEKYYIQDDKHWPVYCQHLNSPVSEYLNHLLTDNNTIDKSKISWNLDGLWVNKQYRLEYNPPHDHTGELSFVIYLKVPKEIYETEEEYPEHKFPGRFNFMTGFGNSPRQCSRHTKILLHPVINEIHDALEMKGMCSMRPTDNDMYIFPSWLTHQVMGFTKDVERISVSGNVNFEVVTN